MRSQRERHAADKLLRRDRRRVRAADQAREPIDVVRERATTRTSERRPFRAALLTGEAPAIIAEIKRASPSVGLIVRELDPAAIARAYEAAGANAISVLTEADHFLGDLAYVDIARKACSLPILRKDFMRTRYEVAQSAAYGADCMLAIVGGALGYGTDRDVRRGRALRARRARRGA